MRPRRLTGHTYGALLLVAVAGALTACGTTSRTSSTSTTAAHVVVPTRAPTAAETSVVDSTPAEATPAANLPAGDLLCRTKTDDGTFELFATWEGPATKDGATGKGSLRRVAPNGNVNLQAVRIQRAGRMIVADDIWETDLARHAATVREQDGAKFIRLEDWRAPWTRCE